MNAIVKVYLYPSYVCLESIEDESKELFKLLNKAKIILRQERWDGTLESIPSGEPVVVRSSSKLNCDKTALAKLCHERGHLCFYGSRYITEDGRYTSEDWPKRVEDFLKNVKNFPDDLLIAYLRSAPKDSSTLGEATHMHRKAALLTSLFRIHPNHVPVDRQCSFAQTAYTVRPSSGTVMDTENATEQMRNAHEALQKLTDEIRADKEELSSMGIVPSSNDMRAKAYCEKLRKSLEVLVSILGDEAGQTGHLYDVHEDAANRAHEVGETHPIGVFLKTFASRRSTMAATWLMEELYKVALPILVEKLVASGVPPFDDVILWDYGITDEERAAMIHSGTIPKQVLRTLTYRTWLSPISVTCSDCGSVEEHRTFQETESDHETPIGAPKIDFPFCYKCQSTNIRPSSESKKD